MKRHILLCATNYVGQSSALKGCLNDMANIKKWLQKAIGSWDTMLELYGPALTKENWLEAMRQFVAYHKPGDEGLHAHSHHGSRDVNNKKASHFRELWVPDNYPSAGMISDDDVSAIYDKLHAEARLTDWADCCHAQGSTREVFFKDERPRFLSISDVADKLNLLSSTPVDVESRPNIAQLAACRSAQTSADAFIDGQYCGAFTTYALQAQGDTMLPEGQLIDDSARLLARNGYAQHPEFCGLSGNALKTIFTLGKAA